MASDTRTSGGVAASQQSTSGLDTPSMPPSMPTPGVRDPMTAPLVVGQRLTRHYGDVVALDGVDLAIAAGEVHGVVGPNGAGKTTLFGLLLGLASPDAGTLAIAGHEVTGVLGVPDGVAGFVDAPGLYPALTARANLVELARLRGVRLSRSAAGDALAEVGLAEVADDRVRGFSLGMRQRLGLAAAVLTGPRLLVLDEPTNGLDPSGRRQVHGVLQRLARSGTAVVVSSHRMEDLARLCHRLTLLANGRVVFTGTTAALAARVTGLDHRLVTSDPAATRALVERLPEVALRSASDDALVVGGPTEALDRLVATAVGHGIAIRELTPVVAPLEAAFLALTEGTGVPDAGVTLALTKETR